MSNLRYKIDLHSHSIISQDGGITPLDYEELITKGIIDCIAITDHNETKLAQKLQQKVGNKIIIGEEITTQEGEIIGLFLEKTIPKDLTIVKAIHEIRNQGGLVYLPHPFETLRKGIQPEIAEKIKQEIDIIEIFNARGFIRGKHQQALHFAKEHNLAMAASSDAHIRFGVGSAYSIITEIPTKKSLVNLLKNASFMKHYAPFFSLLFPTINKMKKMI